MITSRNNPLVIQARKLLHKKERLQAGQFYVEGIRQTVQALETPQQVQHVLICPETLTSQTALQKVDAARQMGIDIVEFSEPVFRSFSIRDNPQGMAAICRQQTTAISDVNIKSGIPWIALDSVQDPGNLGTILRTLDSAGGGGVFILDDSTDPWDPACVRASLGAVFTLKLVISSIEDFSNWKLKSGIFVAGASGEATQDYHTANYPDRILLLMGSEKQGLDDQLSELCDVKVSIPMRGRCDSLNLAVATGIILYEIIDHWRDQRLAPKNEGRI